MTTNHPYLRAYMAGIVTPTIFLLLVLTVLMLIRATHPFPAPIERIIVFPMAVVPNLWGLWNMLYLRLSEGRWLPIGLHGAILPFLLLPSGFALARVLEVPWFSATTAAVTLPVVVAVYYLVWKHLVGYLNELLEVA